MPEIVTLDAMVGNEKVFYRILTNKVIGKKCTECHAAVPEGGQIFKRWDDTIRKYRPGDFCAFRCLAARQRKINEKKEANPERAIKIEASPGIKYFNLTFIVVLAQRKEGKPKRKVVHFASVIDNQQTGRCEYCKRPIFAGQVHYRTTNKQNQFHSGPLCSISCLQSKFEKRPGR